MMDITNFVNDVSDYLKEYDVLDYTIELESILTDVLTNLEFPICYEDRDFVFQTIVEYIQNYIGQELDDLEHDALFDWFEDRIEPYTSGWRNYN